jgi:hypothetical protein
MWPVRRRPILPIFPSFAPLFAHGSNEGRRVGGPSLAGQRGGAQPRSNRALGIERLAAFKTPRKILFLAEIPKGATRKLQGIGLAAKPGLGRGRRSKRWLRKVRA